MVILEDEKRNIDLVSFCGLFCPDCPLYAGRVSDLAIELRRELRRLEYDKFAQYVSKFPSGKNFKYFKEFYLVLGSLMKFRCENGCRLGGGAKDCAIRKCSLEKKIDGCWKCEKFKTCKELDMLNSLHGDKHRQNLKNLHEKGITEFLRNCKDW
jgi:hypothetical protein